ncbi:MAG: hypothetical protein K2R93_12200 [Gemmatimonadaceae bacterium]|nr:hypothetical protein [Gemmatimonadaceae bacterium]
MSRLSKPVTIALTSRAILAFLLEALRLRSTRYRATRYVASTSRRPRVRIDSAAARRGAAEVRAALRAMERTR